MDVPSIAKFYDIKVESFYFERFTDDYKIIPQKKWTNFLELYSYIQDQILYMFKNGDYRLIRAPYLALDLNLNSPEVADQLIEKLSLHFVEGKNDIFRWR